MLTKSDIKLISELFSDKFSESRKLLKDDLLTFKDQILGEIKKLREDVTIVTSYKDQIEDHETRIDKVEDILEIPQN